MSVELKFDPSQVVIVLVRPLYSGNIGSTCRAMKNMGLSTLRLVSPQNFDPEQARWMAAGADDVLQAAQHVETLEDALADVGCVVGTTARDRHQLYPIVTARELPSWILPRLGRGRVAILFGPEDFGLDNDAMGRCEALVRIPTVGLSSLNLAQAVLVVCYELMMAHPPEVERGQWKVATVEERERLVLSLTTLVERVEFLRGRNMELLRGKLRGMMGRFQFDSTEVGVVLGIVRKTLWHLNHPRGGGELGEGFGEGAGEGAGGDAAGAEFNKIVEKSGDV